MIKIGWLNQGLLMMATIGLCSGGTQADKPTDLLSLLRASLEKEMITCLRSQYFSKMEAGIDIVSIDENNPVFQYQPDRQFIPASVTKVITSGICLARFGADFRFQTQILTDGLCQDGVLNGNIYLKGWGDPGLRVSHLDSAARDLRESGISEIRGDLIFDDTFLDEEPPRFPPNARHLYSPPGALTVNSNWIILGLDAGPPVNLWTIPRTNYARLDYQVRLSESNSPGKPVMTYKKMEWGDQYSVRGTVTRWDRRYKILRLCVTRPGLFAATLFKESLARSGIAISGKVRQGLTGPGTRILKIIKTERLKDIIRDLNLESNNVLAELINKDLGATFDSIPGTREKGLNLMRKYLREIIGISGFSLQDSSGLSAGNRFSACQITQALKHFYREMGMNFVGTLAPQGHHPHALSPVPPSGMAMAVKSGTLPFSGVNTIAGYVLIENRRLAFSFAILVNRRGSGPPVYSGTFTIPLLEALVRAFGPVLSSYMPSEVKQFR
jgi:D-alanyl-D-alanine carboxypeptidase/D-alanyl-D-alanine-endopeptidase (penicillin-binding protein 4)